MSRCCRDECSDTRRWGCQRANKTCLERPNDCTGPRPRGVQVCGRCRCRDEEEWDRCKPPEGRRRWAEDFRELRRRWSEHAKRQSCPCDDCKTKSLFPLALEYGEVCPNSPHEDTEDDYDDDYDDDPSPPRTRQLGCHANFKPRESRYQSSQRESRRKVENRDEGRSYCGDKLADDSSCLCQAQPRDCCCPAPVRVDVRATRECSCECLAAPECPCPPSERRFPRRTKCCAVATACAEPKKMIQYKEKSDSAEYTPKTDCRIVCCKENKKDFYQSSRGPGWLAARPGVVGLVSFGLLILAALSWGIDAMARGPEAAVARLRFRARLFCARRACR